MRSRHRAVAGIEHSQVDLSVAGQLQVHVPVAVEHCLKAEVLLEEVRACADLACHQHGVERNHRRGEGAGFPGLPLKILYPNLQLTLVESVGKKAMFCQHNTRVLGRWLFGSVAAFAWVVALAAAAIGAGAVAETGAMAHAVDSLLTPALLGCAVTSWIGNLGALRQSR